MTGASPEDIPKEMNRLLSEMADIPDEKALTAAAHYHVRFESIHPFADGNGRTGRITMNYFLLLHDHPPVIIYEEDRKDYYSALEAWDERQELGSMVNLLKEQTAKTWRRQIEREDRKRY